MRDYSSNESTSAPALDTLFALALSCAACLVYFGTLARRFAFDGPQLASAFALDPEALHWHLLYMPLARAVGQLSGSTDPFGPLLSVSPIATAVGIGASWLIVRNLGHSRLIATLAVAAIGSARNTWLFASTVEVHSVHFAVVSLAALGILRAPWQRPRIALAIAAPLVAATWTSHASAVLMLPGWIAWAALARARSGSRPFTLPTLSAVVAPALGLAMAIVAVPARYFFHREAGLPIDVRLVSTYAAEGNTLEFLREGLIEPMGPVALAALFGWWRARSTRVGLSLVWMAAPALAFFSWWGIPEGGGYFVGYGCFFALAISEALRGLRLPLLALASTAIAVQAIGTRAMLSEFDASLDPAVRSSIAEELMDADPVPDGATSIGTVAFLAPSLTITDPRFEELDLIRPLLSGWRAGSPPQQLVATLRPLLEQELETRTVLLDLTDPGETWNHVDPAFQAYVRDFMGQLLEVFPHERVTRGGWTFVRLQRTRSTETAAR